MSKNASDTVEEAIAKHEADFKDLESEIEQIKNNKS